MDYEYCKTNPLKNVSFDSRGEQSPRHSKYPFSVKQFELTMDGMILRSGLVVVISYYIVSMAAQYGYRQNDPYPSSSYENVTSTAGFPRYPEPTSQWQPDVTQKKGGYAGEPKKNAIKNRIKEIIDLVQHQNGAVTREMGGVIEAERDVYQLLSQADQEQFAKGGHPQNGPGVSQYTPIRGPGTEEYRDPTQAARNVQQSIRDIIQNSRIPLSEEVIQLISQIEKAAMSEIDKLRQEKLILTNSLNEEIRKGNAQKRKTLQLERELAYYRSGQGNAAQGIPGQGGIVGQGNTGSGTEQELRSKIAYLEGLIQQQQQQGGYGVTDLNALYAQGEAIRQDTVRLLKLKQARLGQNNDEEKRQLREQVERLQQKVESLQRGGRGKPSYEVANEYSPIAQNHKRGTSYRNSANDYESLVMEMRKLNN